MKNLSNISPRCIAFRAYDAVGFLFGLALAHLPVCRELPGFDRKVVSLLCLAHGFAWQDLQRELHPVLFIGMSLLLELLILVLEVGQVCSTGLRHMFQTLFTPFQYSPLVWSVPISRQALSRTHGSGFQPNAKRTHLDCKNPL